MELVNSDDPKALPPLDGIHINDVRLDMKAVMISQFDSSNVVDEAKPLQI